MRKVLLGFLVMTFSAAISQNGTLSFGTTIADNTTASSANTGFGGVRVGTGGGSFVILNEGQEIGVDGEIRGIAPSTGAVNSIGITSAEYGTASQTFTTSFEVYLTGGSSGTWYFFAGNGASFGSAQNVGFTGSQTFTGIRWVFGASNTVTTNYRSGANWVSTGLSGTPFAQGVSYTVSIVGNNSASTVNYGTSYSVASNTFDLWVNGTLVGNDLAKAQLGATTDINAFRFYGESSTSNVANIHLDNIKWWGSCVEPSVSSYTTFGSIPPNNYTDINIYSDASLSAATTVSDNLSVKTGATFTTNNFLTLNSTATKTARIATISNAIGTITGNVTCQLYIPGGHRRFRLLSHPFTSAQNINILSGVDYTGGTGTGSGFSVTTPTNNPSVFTFNTANANGGAPNDGGWTSVTSANSGTPWTVGRGIRILIRGAAGEGLTGNMYTPSATTISMTGTINTGGVATAANAGGTGATTNFNLFGNPFAAPINVAAARTSSGNVITKDIYVRNPSTGAYETIDLTVNTNYAIPAYSAFFGIRTGINTSFIVNSSNIVTASSGTTVFSDNASNQKYFELQTLLNGEVYDNMYVKFDSKYKTNFDLNEDGGKPTNEIINAYILSSDNIRLANNSSPFVDGTIIPLGITQNSGKRNLQFKVSSYHLAANQQVTLVDKLLNTRTILDKDVVYNFEIDNANTASVGDNRFALELQAAKVQAIGETLPTANSFTAKLIGGNLIGNNDVQVQIANPTKATTSIRMVNFLGQAISTVQGSQAEQQSINLSTNKLQAGKYLIEVVCGNEKQMISVVKN